MIVLNNNYEIKKILDKYGEEINVAWEYVSTEKISIKDDKNQYDFYVIRFKSNSIHDLFIYTTGRWLCDVQVSCSIPVMEQAKEDLDKMSWDFIDMGDEELKKDNRYEFRDDLEIRINTYSEDIIEANFIEDNGREMNDADWEEYRKLYTMTWQYMIGTIENIIGIYDEDGRDGYDNDCFNWRNFSNVDMNKVEELSKFLHGHKLEESIDDPIYNQIMLYERDWLDEALDANGIKEEDLNSKIFDMVESISIITPKGHPLYFMLGGSL